MTPRPTLRARIAAQEARSASWDARWSRPGVPPTPAWVRVGWLVVSLPLVLGSMNFLGAERGSGRGIVLIAALGVLMVLAAVDAVSPESPRVRTFGRRAVARLRRIRARLLSCRPARRCPYCHDDLLGQQTTTCDGCRAVYHLDCRAEGLGGACATLECRDAPTRADREAQPAPSAQPPSSAAR